MLKFFDLLAERLPLPYVAWIGALVAGVGMSVSKVMLSTGMITMVATAFVYWVHRRTWPDFRPVRGWWFVTGVFFVSFIGIIYTHDLSRWFKDVENKLPFLLLPLSFFVLPRFKSGQYFWLWLAFILTQVVIGAMALAGYLSSRKISDEVIRSNASIDIPGSISHIYFGMVLACSVFACLLLLRSFKLPSWGRIALILIALFQFGLMHIITSRTGLVAMYAGLMGWLIYEVVTRRAWVLGSLVLALLVSVPLFAYRYVYAFRTRVDVTIWDLQQYEHSQNLSHLSASKRLVSWEIAWGIFVQHPVLGVGMGDVKQALFDAYATQRVLISPDQWPANAHNGYLQALAGTGLLGGIINLLALGFPLVTGWRNGRPMLVAVSLAFAFGLLSEALWQREIGIGLYLFVLIWASFTPKINEIQPQHVKWRLNP